MPSEEMEFLTFLIYHKPSPHLMTTHLNFSPSRYILSLAQLKASTCYPQSHPFLKSGVVGSMVCSVLPMNSENGLDVTYIKESQMRT